MKFCFQIQNSTECHRITLFGSGIGGELASSDFIFKIGGGVATSLYSL
jgi:hypothetical protein